MENGSQGIPDPRSFHFRMPVKAVQTWEVIGGAISGGLLVRTGKGLGQDKECSQEDPLISEART